MFAFAPQSPKDYVLKDIPQTQTSGQEFTPVGLPRVTQRNVGKYCFPIEADEYDQPEEIKIESVQPRILDKWAQDWRAYWVDKPGFNSYFLHDVYKTYTVPPISDYDPRYQHKRRYFHTIIVFFFTIAELQLLDVY